MKALLDSASWVFVLGAALMWLANHAVTEWVAATMRVDPLLAWFLSVLLVVALPLFLIFALVLQNEGCDFTAAALRRRLRFAPMTTADWRATLVAVGVVTLASAPIAALLYLLAGPESLHPPFMGSVPLGPDRLWLLLAWLPFWVVNVMGEEILWRGLVQPRQERVFGSRAGLVNSIGWAIFHIAFGWKLVVMLIPILIVLPRTVQRTSNTWCGVLIHAVLNGPAFIAVSLGLV